MAPHKHKHPKNMLPIIPQIGVISPFAIPPQNKEIVNHHGRIYLLVFFVILAAGIFVALYFTGIIRFTLPVVPAHFPPPPLNPITDTHACVTLNCPAKGPNWICNDTSSTGGSAVCVCNPPFGGPNCDQCNYAGPWANVASGPQYGNVTMQLSPSTTPPCKICQMVISTGQIIDLPNVDIGSCSTCTGNLTGNLGSDCLNCQSGSGIGDCPGTGTGGGTTGTPGTNTSCSSLNCPANAPCGTANGAPACICSFKPPCGITWLAGCDQCMFPDQTVVNSVLVDGVPRCPSSNATAASLLDPSTCGPNPSNEPAFVGIVIGICLGLMFLVVGLVALLYYGGILIHGPQSAFFVLMNLLAVLGLGFFIFGVICWADFVCWYNDPTGESCGQYTGLFKGGLAWQQNGALWLGLVVMCLCILVLNVAQLRGYGTKEARTNEAKEEESERVKKGTRRVEEGTRTVEEGTGTEEGGTTEAPGRFYVSYLSPWLQAQKKKYETPRAPDLQEQYAAARHPPREGFIEV